jgi:hypothetical protein
MKYPDEVRNTSTSIILGAFYGMFIYIKVVREFEGCREQINSSDVGDSCIVDISVLYYNSFLRFLTRAFIFKITLATKSTFPNSFRLYYI